MNGLDFILLVASVAIIFRAEPAMNRMSRTVTPLLVKVSVWVMGCSALGIIVSILFAPVYRDPSCFSFMAGAALFLFFALKSRRKFTDEERRDHLARGG